MHRHKNTHSAQGDNQIYARIMNTITIVFDQVCTSSGILVIMLISLVSSFLMMLKLRGAIRGPGLGFTSRDGHGVKFDC